MTLSRQQRISIHALLAESDPTHPADVACGDRFLSTLSLRRATTWARGSRVTYVISIHALLAESDTGSLFFLGRRKNFYPRSPCGERPGLGGFKQRRIDISIHALLAESDLRVSAFTNYAAYFYPRSPCGERPPLASRAKTILAISIHALLAESDVNKIAYQRKIDQFLSTLSLRRATQKLLKFTYKYVYFYPRSPCGERQVNNPVAALTSISIHALLAESDQRESADGMR